MRCKEHRHNVQESGRDAEQHGHSAVRVRLEGIGLVEQRATIVPGSGSGMLLL